MINKLLISIFLFLYIYIPPICTINILNILSVVSCIGIVVHFKIFKDIIKKMKTEKYILCMLLIIVYLSFVVIFNTGNIKNIYSLMLFIVQTSICGIYIIGTCIRLQLKEKEILKILLYVTLFQSVLSILSYCDRNLQQIFIDLSVKTGESREIINIFKEYRYFGFSSQLTFTMPIVQVLMIFILWIKFRPQKFIEFITNIIMSGMLLFSAIINARISIIILGLGIISLIVLKLIDLKKKNNFRFYIISGSLVVFIITMILVYPIFRNNIKITNETLQWIFASVDELYGAIFMNKSSVTLSNLFGEIKMPESWSLVFGTGNTVYYAEQYRTDVGYINDIWLGGIIYCITLYGAVSYWFLKSSKDKENEQKSNQMIRSLIVIMMLVANIKGQIFYSNSLTSLAIVLVFYFNIEDYEKKINTEETYINRE